MAKVSVRSIVLKGFVAEKSVEEIIQDIRLLRPESTAGEKEVKWYFSKMKLEGFLDENGKPTRKGVVYTTAKNFKSSTTQKPKEVVSPKLTMIFAQKEAKEAADLFGGKPSQYLPECLKTAWKMFKQNPYALVKAL